MEYHNLLRPGGAESAGTMVNNDGGEVADWDGEPENIIEVMNETGINISANKRAQLTPELLRKYSKIVVMTQPEFRPDYLVVGGHVVYWDIPDPHRMSLEDTRVVRDTIKMLVGQLALSANGQLVHSND